MQFLNKVFAFTIYNVLEGRVILCLLLDYPFCWKVRVAAKSSIVNRRCRCFDNYLSIILFSSYSPAIE